MGEIRTTRRYYAAKAEASALAYEHDAEILWRARQQAEPGTLFPASVPLQEKLRAAGYVVLEDVLGADEAELLDAGLAEREAGAVVKALAALEGV
jgi:hypothetical protein